mmetsp:Transcript_41510/g.81873  ORF Transcript_41510/g.81873 Transcript_41510/m.81873 type:complete len:111 (-) Transcript_41510:546-878(-)
MQWILLTGMQYSYMHACIAGRQIEKSMEVQLSVSATDLQDASYCCVVCVYTDMDTDPGSITIKYSHEEKKEGKEGRKEGRKEGARVLTDEQAFSRLCNGEEELQVTQNTC